MAFRLLSLTLAAAAVAGAAKWTPPEETMHEPLIRQCNALAESAVENGNHPFGALLVKNGEVVLTAENTVVTEKDITGHAETNLVREAGKRFDPETLSQTTLYTSTEPCIMCQGAIYWSGIRKIVFGVSSTSLARLTDGTFDIPSRETYSKIQPTVEVIGPVLQEDGMEIHKSFWK